LNAKPFQKQGQNSIVVLQVRKKALQISSMWRRVEEMEQVAKGTSGMLKQMQEKLEAMETETSQQRQRASDNEQELSRVRHDFGVLRISVDNLIKARETIHLLEKRIHEVEMLSERYYFTVTLPLIQF
jgi:soluble cytochrome b562